MTILKSMPRMHGTTSRIRSVLTYLFDPFCTLLVLVLFFPFDRFQSSVHAKFAFVGLEFGLFKKCTSDVSILRLRELCTASYLC